MGMSEEHYETYVRPMLGNKAEEIDLLRATERANRMMSVDRRYANNVKANNGQSANEFNPTESDIKTAMGIVFREPWKDIPDNYGLFMRIQDAAIEEAQRRSAYSANGKALPLKGKELQDFISGMYRDITASS